MKDALVLAVFLYAIFSTFMLWFNAKNPYWATKLWHRYVIWPRYIKAHKTIDLARGAMVSMMEWHKAYAKELPLGSIMTTVAEWPPQSEQWRDF